MNSVMKLIASGVLLISTSACHSDDKLPADSTSLPAQSDTTIPPVTQDPPINEEKIKVLLVSRTETANVKATDCRSVIQMLDTFPAEYITGLQDKDMALLRFTNATIDRFDNRYSSLNGSILADADAWMHYQLKTLEVDEKAWRSREDEAIDFSQAALETDCVAIKQMKVQTDEYSLTPVTQLLNWKSSEAIGNQKNYDDELIDTFKSLYGRNGLGYGDFAKAGIHFKHMPSVPGSEWDYNEFSLHWVLSYPDLEAISAERLPDAIATQFSLWQQECTSVEMQFAKDIHFIDSAPAIANLPSQCHEHPLFLTQQPIELSDTNSVEFLQYLSGSQRLHKVTQEKNTEGQFVHCNPQDIISMEGCSQPIVRKTGALLEGFIKEEHDLYVRVTFGQFITRTYHLNRLNGVMTELEHQKPDTRKTL